MSHGQAIDPLPIDQFPTEQDVSDPGFEELFNELVGIAATDADGFDDAVAIASSLLDSLDAALGELGGQDGGTLDDTFAGILAVDTDAPGEDVANLTTALPDVQSNVDNLGNLIAGAALPTPPTAPGALPAGCAAVAGFDTTSQTPPITRQFTFGGAGPTVTITVDSATLDQDTPGLFTMTTDPTPAILQPGGVFNISVTLTTTAPSGMHGQVTVKWHGSDNAENSIVLCLGVDVPDNFPQPTGGGGGGGGGNGGGGGGGGRGGPPPAGGGSNVIVRKRGV